MNSSVSFLPIFDRKNKIAFRKPVNFKPLNILPGGPGGPISPFEPVGPSVPVTEYT